VSDQQQEMHDEINVLVGSLAKAFKMEGPEAAKALEEGHMVLNLGTDADGERFVEANFKGQVAFVYPGSAKQHMTSEAIKLETEI